MNCYGSQINHHKFYKRSWIYESLGPFHGLKKGCRICAPNDTLNEVVWLTESSEQALILIFDIEMYAEISHQRKNT